jgi:orotate phosphoribosyltransferase
MSDKQENIGEKAARILVDIGAVNWNLETPFILTSGAASPVYVDCRRLISYVRERREIVRMLAEKVKTDIGLKNIEIIAGGETAGIPLAAWLSEELSLPMVYVRKKTKGFGKNKLIEGVMERGQKVLLLEDLATTAKSKLSFCEALREAGAEVSHTLVIFEYGCYPDTDKELESVSLTLHSLATWEILLQTAEKSGLIKKDESESIRDFLSDPVSWSKKHGGA